MKQSLVDHKQSLEIDRYRLTVEMEYKNLHYLTQQERHERYRTLTLDLKRLDDKIADIETKIGGYEKRIKDVDSEQLQIRRNLERRSFTDLLCHKYDLSLGAPQADEDKLSFETKKQLILNFQAKLERQASCIDLAYFQMFGSKSPHHERVFRLYRSTYFQMFGSKSGTYSYAYAYAYSLPSPVA